jgi:hypothetical protein
MWLAVDVGLIGVVLRRNWRRWWIKLMCKTEMLVMW